MDRLWRSNSFINFRTGCPPDIVNEEDHNVNDSEIPDFRKWTIHSDTKNVYKISWAENTFHSAYKVRTIEQIFSISKTHEKCCLFTKKNIGEFLASKIFSYFHIGMVQVAIKPLTRKGINASVLMCWFKLLLNISPGRALMLLFSFVYVMLDLRTLKIAFLV